jgi:PAS domain S-box-containing protein
MASARRIQLAAIIALALALLAAGALVLNARADALRMAGELRLEHQPDLLVGELEGALRAAESSELAYLLSAQPGRLAAYDQARQRISELTSQLARLVETPAEREQLVAIRAAVSRQLAALARLIALPPGGRSDPQLVAASTHQDQELSALLARLDALATGYRQQAHARRERQEAQLGQLTLALDVLGGALLLLLGVVAVGLARSARQARRSGQALGEMEAQLASQSSGRDRDQRAGEERRRLVFSRLQIGTWEFGLDDHQLINSREALDLLGGPSQPEVVGEAGFLALVCAQDRERVRQAFAAALTGDGTYAAEFQVCWADGQRRWIATHATVMRDGSGRPLRLVGIHQDVSERKRAEAALRDSEERLSLAVEAARLGTWDWEYACARVTLSATARSLFGLAADALIDLSGLDLAIDERDRARVQEARAISAHTAAGLVIEFRVRWRDGSLHWLCLWSLPRRDAGGAVTGQVGMVQDLTERKLGEDQIRERNLELEARVAARTELLRQANQELEAFTYSVSHDLRAPLRAIDGFSAALLEDHSERLDHTGRDHLERVRRAATRMAELIDDLLALSRVSLSQITTAPCDLSALAGEVAAALAQSHPERRLELAIQPGVVALADARLLRIVLENLLGNAVKFSARRDPAHIAFGARSSDGARVMFVADDGAGFDMAYAGKLFAPFQRLHQASEFPGTGVGLAIVQRIIHRHGGRVWAEAAVDAGTTISFTLP